MPAFISFIGPPGSGKTTQIRMLEAELGPRLVIASVPRLVRGQPDLIDLLDDAEQSELASLLSEAAQARNLGELAPFAVDRLLFAALTRIENAAIVALDGSPRGLVQAQLFTEYDAVVRQTTIVELGFAGPVREQSLNRQLSRESGKVGVAVASARSPVFERKIGVFLDDTLAGLAWLKAAGVPHLALDACDTPDVIHASVMQLVARTTACL